MSFLRRLLGRAGRNADDLAHDAWLGDALGTLDPAHRHPGYWAEFQRGVLLSAGAELARRRRRTEVTLSDVLFSWSRALVPAAAVASLAAFFVLKPPAAEIPAPLRLEEILWANSDPGVTDVGESLAVEVSLAVDVY